MICPNCHFHFTALNGPPVRSSRPLECPRCHLTSTLAQWSVLEPTPPAVTCQSAKDSKTTTEENERLDYFRDAITTAKIVASIFCGAFAAFLQIGLFNSWPLAIIASVLACVLLLATFFGSKDHRKNFASVLATLFIATLVVGGLVQVDRETYYKAFVIFASIVVFGLGIGFLIAILKLAGQGESIDHTLPVNAIVEQAANLGIGNDQSNCQSSHPVRKRKKPKVSRRWWGYDARKRIWNAYGRKCYICHQPLPTFKGDHMHLDHKHPISRGGQDTEENLAACCPRCNREKHDHDHPELYS